VNPPDSDDASSADFPPAAAFPPDRFIGLQAIGFC
jgi:hypothetical protein